MPPPPRCAIDAPPAQRHHAGHRRAARRVIKRSQRGQRPAQCRPLPGSGSGGDPRANYRQVERTDAHRHQWTHHAGDPVPGRHVLLRARAGLRRRGAARRRSIMLHSTAGGREEEHSVLAGFTRVLGDGVVFNPLLIGEDRLAHLGRTSCPPFSVSTSRRQVSPPAVTTCAPTIAAPRTRRPPTCRPWGDAASPISAPSTPPRPSRHTPPATAARYDRALKAGRGLPGDPDGARLEPGGRSQAVRTLLQEHPEVDAIVCGNDDLARVPCWACAGWGSTCPARSR